MAKRASKYPNLFCFVMMIANLIIVNHSMVSNANYILLLQVKWKQNGVEQISFELSNPGSPVQQIYYKNFAFCFCPFFGSNLV